MTTAAPTLSFPSLEWFQALADRVAAPEHAAAFRRLGVTDTAFALAVGEDAYRIAFDGFEVGAVTEWDHAAPVDFVLSGSVAGWRDLLAHPGSRTLNSVVLAGGDFQLSGDDQLGIDCFYRYNPTIEAFIELAADLSTEDR
jgi:hypothetical protein